MSGMQWGASSPMASYLPPLPNLAFPSIGGQVAPGAVGPLSLPQASQINPLGPSPLAGLKINPMPQQQSWFGGLKDELGGWGGMAKFGLDAVTGLGELWAANQALKLSKAQFNFNKEFATKNFNNQVQTHNTRLEDRANTRAVMQGQTDAERDAYIAKNRLPGGN